MIIKPTPPEFIGNWITISDNEIRTITESNVIHHGTSVTTHFPSASEIKLLTEGEEYSGILENNHLNAHIVWSNGDIWMKVIIFFFEEQIYYTRGIYLSGVKCSID